MKFDSYFHANYKRTCVSIKNWKKNKKQQQLKDVLVVQPAYMVDCAVFSYLYSVEC